MNILFIVNPISGKKKKNNIDEILHGILDNTSINFEIKYTEYAGHANKLASENVGKYNTIIAAGGDGTVNEVARALILKDTVFGIIPLGSGNGLARSLKIPVNTVKAVENIVNGNVKKIDSGIVNEKPFINISGIGFDAEVAHLFNKSKTRGFKTYFNVVAKKFSSYKPHECIIRIKGQDDIITKPFLVSFANSSQWGNNAYISPISNQEDGLLEICILEKFPIAITPFLVGRLFLKNIHNSPFMNIFQTDACELQFKNKVKGHIDGEPVQFDNTLKIKILKHSINIITP